ncbi:hypothetical protein [uncultured Pseudacidovorax sp.]|uniref:hypothetical protein n=1 Tax=uncultured Pseudacidovorax sp. TaxID=679313 RepID=UPI0025CE7A3C|nr:hypothetical protein [uncultured Pseudacidovorax sp.]
MVSPKDMLAHLRWLTAFDPNYARWRAQQAAKEDPDALRHLPATLDEELQAAGLECGPIWTGRKEGSRRRAPPAGPALDRRPFIERVRDEFPDCFPARMRNRRAE